MNKIALLSPEQRNELFAETAREMKTTEAIVEKDFWVVWTLDKIFADKHLGKVLKFKGGTSLSKVYDLIGRFSEDIDLILDWREVTGEDPYQERTKTKQSKFNEATNEAAQTYIREALLPLITKLLEPLCSCAIDGDDPHSINITYPSAFKDIYLRPQILLEIGPLASWTPSDVFEISSFAAQKFPRVFEDPSCRVDTILAERTFWEKATILHQEAHRPEEKPLPSRHARHYYDLTMMASDGVKEKALDRIDLLEQVVEFKKRFYPSGWAKYDEARIGTLKLLPPEFRYAELRKDYTAMQNMIFDKKLSFDAILKTLEALESEINSAGDGT
jgi:Nucleotidyl transferase AbiEii toxin, Type IV TA system